MKTYSIRLQKYDDLLTIQDKITWSNTARVILVFPDRSRIIRDRKDFVLIQRFSKEKGYLIAVVIKDSELREEAQRSGLVVFRTIDEAQKGGWKKPYNPNLELKMDQIAFDVNPVITGRIKSRPAGTKSWVDAGCKSELSPGGQLKDIASPD